MTGRVRVFLAQSLDGFVAGPDDDLSWLSDGSWGDPELPGDPGALTFDRFIADVGALLMGRRTYDVVRGMGIEWPYDRPVLVATRRPLGGDAPPGVRAVSGEIAELVQEARETAGARDVYLDGGELVRHACAGGLVDELVLTLIPVALGGGVPLFQGGPERLGFRLESVHRYPGGAVQLRLTPAGAAPPRPQ